MSSTTHSATHTPLQFYLSALDGEANATDITFDGADISLPSVDAEAVLFMKASVARSIFKIQTDASDVNTITSSDDVKYYVDFTSNIDPSGSINPVHFMMDISQNDEVPTGYANFASKNPVRKFQYNGFNQTTNELDSNRMLVKHDFARHIIRDNYGGLIANQLDIFDHEDAWKTAMSLEGLRLYKALYDALTTAEGLVQTDASSGNTNFSRVLLRHIIANDPGRLDASGGATDNSLNNYKEGQLQQTEGVQPVPLVAGDVIAFLLTLKEDASQNTIHQDATNAGLGRTYLCKLCLIDDTDSAINFNNTQPNDTLDFARVDFTGSAVTNDVTFQALLHSTLKTKTATTNSYYTRQQTGTPDDFFTFHGLTGGTALPVII